MEHLNEVNVMLAIANIVLVGCIVIQVIAIEIEKNNFKKTQE